MIRLVTLTLCTALISLPTLAYEGPQEQALDKSLAETQSLDNPAPATVTASPVTTLPAPPQAAKVPQSYVGPNERRLDQGLDTVGSADPQGDAAVRRLNGGQ